jgi:hypothetical protein
MERKFKSVTGFRAEGAPDPQNGQIRFLKPFLGIPQNNFWGRCSYSGDARTEKISLNSAGVSTVEQEEKKKLGKKIGGKNAPELGRYFWCMKCRISRAFRWYR